MGHRVAVMKDGVLQQCAPPNEVYNEPANIFVASFIGSPSMNMLSARIDRTDPSGPSLVAGTLRRRLSATELAQLDHATHVVLGVRPEHVEPRLVSDADATCFVGVVRVVEPLGSDQFVTVQLDEAHEGSDRLTARLRPDERVRVGDRVRLRSALGGAHLFSQASGARLMTFAAAATD